VPPFEIGAALGILPRATPRVGKGATLIVRDPGHKKGKTTKRTAARTHNAGVKLNENHFPAGGITLDDVPLPEIGKAVKIQSAFLSLGNRIDLVLDSPQPGGG